MIYITTDTHFNHTKIHEFCTRPKDYEKRIFDHFLKLTEDDILIHLGDICIGDVLSCHENYIMPVKAKKILIRGYHDKKSDSWYMDHGWNFVCEKLTNTYYGVKVCFTHKPIAWDGDFGINIHGHLHDLSHRSDKTNALNHLISIERDGCIPLSLRSILEPIKQRMNLLEVES